MELQAAERRPLFAFIADLARGNGGVLPDSSVLLPDEDALETPGGLRWSAGALDGIVGHHGFGNGAPDAERVLEAIRSAAARDAAAGFDELYAALREEDCLPVVVEAVAADPRIDRRHLRLLMSFVARRAPDRGPVKFALAVLGAFGKRGEQLDVFTTFGLHDEFALYAVVALLRLAGDPEGAVWSVAKAVTGWGRIAAIERLAGTARPEIKRWLVRQGYENRVMNEYTALICAETGDLAGELSRPNIDEEVRRGAGAILQALIAEGPVDGISRYGAASRAVRLYVGHVRRKPVGTSELHTLLAIRDYLDARPDDTEDRLDAWTDEEHASYSALVGTLVAPDLHAGRLREEIVSGAADESWYACHAARGLGLDVWDHVFARLRSDPLAEAAPWWDAMQAGDSARVRAVADFAEQALPLDRMASGPALDMWPTRDAAAHGALGYVLQDLGPHPGVGAALIRAGLRSPVVRNRNMALRALSEWPRERRIAEWLPLLDAAHAAEPDPDVKARIAALREECASAVEPVIDDGEEHHQ